MHDAPALAALILEEARLYATTKAPPVMTASGLTPHETDEQKLATALEYGSLPDKEPLAYVLDEAFWSSMLMEEGRPCRPRLLYGPKRPREPLHRFVEALSLTRDAIRKLAPTQGAEGLLCWDHSSGVARITGVQGYESSHGNLAIVSPFDLTISLQKPGAIDVDWWAARILSVRAGHVQRMSKCRLPDMESALRHVAEVLGSHEPHFFGRALKCLVQQGHGGAVWIMQPGRQAEGISLGYPLQVDGKELLLERGADRMMWLRSLAPLAAVDGAVLIDSRANLIGFGAFVEAGAPSPVLKLMSDGTTTTVDSTATGGGRHRSAVEFCRRFGPSAAIVVSEDGRISTFSTRNAGAPPVWQELSGVGMLLSLP